jgi:hypothetical protein
MSGTRYRIPRKVKSAMRAYHAGRTTAKQRRLLHRCWVRAPHGWRSVRKGNLHVAMGDTSTLRCRERHARQQVQS